jgi:cytochrome b subunit of formate dehydrogenase
LFFVVSSLFLENSSIFTLYLDFFHCLSTLFWCFQTCRFLFLFFKVCHGYVFLAEILLFTKADLIGETGSARWRQKAVSRAFGTKIWYF